MKTLRWMVSAGAIAAALAGAAAPGAWGADARATAATPPAADTTAAAKPAAARQKTAKSKSVKTASVKTASARTAAARPPATATTPEPARDPAGPRTLDEITIEGEIPVPQVLFITARDQRRFLDLRHHRYLKNSQRVGETTVYPSWISVAHGVTPEEPRP